VMVMTMMILMTTGMMGVMMTTISALLVKMTTGVSKLFLVHFKTRLELFLSFFFFFRGRTPK